MNAVSNVCGKVTAPSEKTVSEWEYKKNDMGREQTCKFVENFEAKDEKATLVAEPQAEKRTRVLSR